MPGIGNAVVATGRFIKNNPQVAIGGALALAGAAKLAFLKTPEATSKSKYLGNLMFPADLVDPSANRNAYMAIQFVEYQRRSIFNQPFLSATGGIRLPVPSELRDNTQVSYSPSGPTDPAIGAAIEGGLAGRNGVGSSGSVASAVLGAFGGGAAGAITKATAGLTAATGMDTAQALQLGGLAQNPFLTVLFQAPTFKKHSFSWKLAPNNEEESNTVKEIIDTLRSNMLPAMAPNAGGTLLTYPNMAIINLYPDETFLYRFKPCVIESLDVNFAVGGQPSFFKNTNAPTLVQININFLEIEYWLKEDIENNSLRSKGALFG
jgi:hypothetical protein